MGRTNKQNDDMTYLISFLMLLIIRAGGTMKIENLKDLAGKELAITMNLDKEKAEVTLTVTDLHSSTSN